jgi:peptide deformylase
MIVTYNEQVLRKECEDVSIEEVDSLVSILEEELKRINKLGGNGIGLAAPQIGINKKIAIIRLGGKLNINLVNSKIEKGYDPKVFNGEGCLSFPGKTENTTRFQEVYITNNLVYPHNFVATGLLAVVCQHEIDHLNGVLFFDRANKEKEIKQINKIKVGPNDPCICGKEDPVTKKIKKFKKCCGKG